MIFFSVPASCDKLDNVPDRQEKLKQQMFLLEDKENEWFDLLLYCEKKWHQEWTPYKQSSSVLHFWLENPNKLNY